MTPTKFLNPDREPEQPRYSLSPILPGFWGTTTGIVVLVATVAATLINRRATMPMKIDETPILDN
jgi:hypothetical protein